MPSASRKLPVAERASAATAAGGISIDSACAVRRTTLAICSTVGRWKSKRWQRSTTVGGHLLGLGRRQHEHRVRRRLLECLQERVPGGGREHVRLVEDVHLAPAATPARRRRSRAARGCRRPSCSRRRPSRSHRASWRARSRRHDSHSPARLDRRPVLAVQAGREDLRHRGLARAARADEQVGVVDLARSTALRSVRTTGSWPTTSANVRGRCRRYSDRCCCSVAAPLATPSVSLPALGRPRPASPSPTRARADSVRAR